MNKFLAVITLGFVLTAATVFAGDRQYQSDAAVADILFSFDGSEEYASYAVREDGFVDITFARNIPDELYGAILSELQNDPRIPGVISGKTGPVCVFTRYK